MENNRPESVLEKSTKKFNENLAKIYSAGHDSSLYFAENCQLGVVIGYEVCRNLMNSFHKGYSKKEYIPIF